MTRQEAAKLLPIIQAFSEGKTIQRIEKYNGMDCAVDIKSNDINFDNYSSKYYRIKPSPTYRPFANAEECWNEMVMHQPVGWVKHNIDEYRALVTVVNNHGCFISSDKRLFLELFENFTFIDDSAFGVKVEEE